LNGRKPEGKKIPLLQEKSVGKRKKKRSLTKGQQLRTWADKKKIRVLGRKTRTGSPKGVERWELKGRKRPTGTPGDQKLESRHERPNRAKKKKQTTKEREKRKRNTPSGIHSWGQAWVQG